MRQLHIDHDILGKISDYLMAAEDSRIIVHMRNVAGMTGDGRELLDSGLFGVPGAGY